MFWKLVKSFFLHIFTICEWAIYYTKLLDNSRGHQQKQQHVPWLKVVAKIGLNLGDQVPRKDWDTEGLMLHRLIVLLKALPTTKHVRKTQRYIYWLVVWNMNFIFPYIGNVIIPTDFHSIIFQRGRSTTNQYTDA